MTESKSLGMELTSEGGPGMDRTSYVICINPDEELIAVWDHYQLMDRGLPDGWMTLTDFEEAVWTAKDRGDILGSVSLAEAVESRHSATGEGQS